METKETLLPIGICPHEPRATLDIDPDEILRDALLACTGPGDAEPACRHVLDTWTPRFVIWDSSLGKHRTAKPSEVQATCEAIYFDSESDFAQPTLAALYLIWEAANSYAQESNLGA